jgi:hypothetical protein
LLRNFLFFGIGAIVITLLFIYYDTFSDFVNGSVILSTIAEGFAISFIVIEALLTIFIIVAVALLPKMEYTLFFYIGIIMLVLLFIVFKKFPTAVFTIAITFVIAIGLLFATYNSNIEFTRIIEGRTWGLQPSDSSYYRERVLVRNISRNKPHDLEQSKIMIAYFDSVGLSIDDLLKMPEIKYYYMSFYKSTYATRKHFVKGKKVSTYNGNKTYLGVVSMTRCNDDSTKWRVRISRNLGTEDDYDKIGPKTKDEFLQNECDPEYDPYWREVNKDNELVKYYMELREKRKKVE